MKPDRARRLSDVAAARLGWVECALEHVHHRHNASAMLRTADALGVHRVHMVGDRAFRASVGPARGADRWLDLHAHADTASAIADLHARGVALWVADLDADAVAPEDLPLDQPVCLWFGAEVLGVDPIARAAAAGVVGLRMHGFAQSLNVSVAAGMVLHTVTERARRRGRSVLLSAEEQAHAVAAWTARDLTEEADATREVKRQRGLSRALRDDG